MSRLDLNADLGEGEAPARTNALMRYIHSANIACGGHAGCPNTMTRTIAAARRNRVRLGAHPGLWSHEGAFGRNAVPLKPGDLQLLLLHQVSALQQIARAAGSRLHHIKLHGALYHIAESDSSIARAYVEAVRRWWPHLKVFALAGGTVARWGRAAGLVVWDEAFLDRAYLPDGRLLPRDRPGAVLTSPHLLQERIRQLKADGTILAVDGSHLAVSPRTLCIHSDTAGAVRLARQAALWLAGAKVCGNR